MGSSTPCVIDAGEVGVAAVRRGIGRIAVAPRAALAQRVSMIEVAGMPDLALLVGHLQADYGARTLVLGREIWRAGDRSRSKRRLSELVDAFLADLDVELDEPLPDGPVCYVGRGG